MTRLVRGAHSELVHVAFAKHDHAGMIEPSDNGCVIGGNEVSKHFRTASGRETLGAEDVLVQHRDPE